MLDVIRTPRLAAEVTLQPLRRFPLDAAIIFADILNPLIGMGMELDFVKGEGPKIFNPIRSEDDVKRLTVPAASDNVAYTLEAIAQVRAGLKEFDASLIGFSGAPFTLSCYMIEGQGTNKFHETRQFMFQQEPAFHQLQEKLTALVTEYLIAQVEAGAEAVQLFDSWLGLLGPAEYTRFVAPYVTRIVTDVKAATRVPFIFFGVGTAALYPWLKDLGADVLGVDWRLPLQEAARLTQHSCALQGNLDPIVLASATPDYLDEQVDRILAEGREVPAHIFNVGHGLVPHTPPEHVARVVERIRRSAS